MLLLRVTLPALSFLLLLLIAQRTYCQSVSDIYQFDNTLDESGLHCGPPLVPATALGSCPHDPGGGQYVQDDLPSCGLSRTVYRNNMNWGLQYPNTGGVIGETYTIHLYVKTTDFGARTWARIIDFSNGNEDAGIYYKQSGSSSGRCLDFYPNGPVGACPYFTSDTYYLLTFSRNGATGIIDVYVNSVLFTSFDDKSGKKYIGKSGVPIYIYRDDKVVTCESGVANFAYASFGSFYSSQQDVNAVYAGICSLANKHLADFSLAKPILCAPGPNTITYTGLITAPGTGYSFSWDWDGGTVLSGSGMGPYTVQWMSAGTKKIALTVGSGCRYSSSDQSLIVSDLQAVTASTPAFCSTAMDGVIELHGSGGTLPYRYAVDNGAYQADGVFAASPGTYTVHIGDATGCDVTAPVTVDHLNDDQFDHLLGNDTAICPGASFTASAVVTGMSFLWQDGSTNDHFLIDRAGDYQVQLQHGGCVYTSRKHVDLKPEPPAFLAKDTLVCANVTLLLDVSGVGGSYLWPDGGTGPRYEARPGRLYVVQITRAGCIYSDSIMVHALPLPAPALGPDRSICQGEAIVLKGEEHIDHLWQDGSIGLSFTASQPGRYILRETNGCGVVSDTVDLARVVCDVEFPSAFTPGGSANSLFHALHAYSVTAYRMEVYNRWGQTVFATGDVSGGWDGRINGALQPPGTYVWMARFTTRAGETKMLQGTVVLIR